MGQTEIMSHQIGEQFKIIPVIFLKVIFNWLILIMRIYETQIEKLLYSYMESIKVIVQTDFKLNTNNPCPLVFMPLTLGRTNGIWQR